MAALQAIPARGSTLTDPQRTTAVLAIRAEIEEILGHFHDELDEWAAGGADVVIRDARSKLVAAVQRVNALEQLGPPSDQALEQLRDAQDS